jgi:hypothetical protein
VDDLWCFFDLNGSVEQICFVDEHSRVIHKPRERACARYEQYIKNHPQLNTSIYYSGDLSLSPVIMIECDNWCKEKYGIAVKQASSESSIIIKEALKRMMFIVMHVVDMDHTQGTYMTVRCLTNDRPTDACRKSMAIPFDKITINDEIAVHVSPTGCLTFSCNNRQIKKLFNIDLTVNDKANVQRTNYNLEFIMNGRITALRLIGVYQPSENETQPPQLAPTGNCRATNVHSVCLAKPSGLLLPCKHLCVCFNCGVAMINQHPCPKTNCHQPVVNCIRVYKD